MIISLKTKLSEEAKPKKGERLLTQLQAAKICSLDNEALSILEKSSFKSQARYSWRRAVRISNIINDFFEAKDFEGTRILELGPGHYGFALIARFLGAQVVCIEREPALAELGRYLGFEVWAKDFNEISGSETDGKFDGLWIKGTFNACNYITEEDIEGFVKKFTDLLRLDGWGWCVTVNKTSNKSENDYVSRRIDIQRKAFLKHGWQTTRIKEADRKRYAIKYLGCYYYFTYNLAPSCNRLANQNQLVQDCLIKALPASKNNMFNKVSTIWKPTLEYYENPWQYYVEFIDILKRKVAHFITMSTALEGNYNPDDINVILDHHIDFYPVETEIMCRWELEQGVISNIYLFNRFDYTDTPQRRRWNLEDLNIPFYQHLEQHGFEIGYHQNAVAQAKRNNVTRDYSQELTKDIINKAKEYFANDVDCLRKYFDIRTFIPHGAGEGNNQLMDLPEGYEDVVWVYNNAHRNKTRKTPISWNNFSDSCGVNPQRIKTNGAQYIVNVDNLHLFANLAGKGINHILVHPGRFSKGMPYENFNETKHVVGRHVRYEFRGVNEKLLPLVTSDLIDQWEGQKGAEIRKRRWENRSDSYKIRKRSKKIYVLSDSAEILLNHMAANRRVVPFFLVAKKITEEEKEYYRVPRPATNTVRFPVRPCDSIFEHKAPTNRLFFEQFRNMYNIVYAESIIEELVKSDMNFDVVHLTNLSIDSRKKLQLLHTLLFKYVNKPEFVMQIHMECTALHDLRRIFEGDQGSRVIEKKYSITIRSPGESEEDSHGFVLDIMSKNIRQPGIVCCMTLGKSFLSYTSSLPRKWFIKLWGRMENLARFLWRKIRKRRWKGRMKRNNNIKGNKYTNLSPQEKEKLNILAKTRGESPEVTLKKFSKKDISRCPPRFSKHLTNLMNAEVECAGVSDGLSYLTLPNGRIFYGHISHSNHQRAYYYVRDLLPKQLDKYTFLLGLDVVQRYSSNFAWLPKKILPERGGIIVEAGAYLGHKTIRFVDDVVGTEGKVLAIEMMPDNVQILRKNIIKNGLESCVDVLEVGVWKERSEMKVLGKSRQRNTLIHLEKLDKETGLFVSTYSLDEILENWGYEPVDLLYITLNGAEIEALQGLKTKLDAVKIIFVAAPYTREGIPNADVVHELLKEKGCHVLYTRGACITAVTPRYKDEFV